MAGARQQRHQGDRANQRLPDSSAQHIDLPFLWLTGRGVFERISGWVLGILGLHYLIMASVQGRAKIG